MSGSAVEIDVSALESQLTAKLVQELVTPLLEQLKPQLDHVDEAQAEVKKEVEDSRRAVQKRVAGWSGSLLLSLAITLYLGYRSYTSAMGDMSKATKANAAQLVKVSKTQDEQGKLLNKIVKEQPAELRRVKVEYCALHERVQILYKREYGDKAQPVRCPFWDVMTSASP